MKHIQVDSQQMLDEAEALVCPDLHLQYGAWKNRGEIHGDSLHFLSEFCRLALKMKKLRFVIFPGDIFDVPYPEPYIVHQLYQFTEKLKFNKNCSSLFVLGQHDLPLNHRSKFHQELSSSVPLSSFDFFATYIQGSQFYSLDNVEYDFRPIRTSESDKTIVIRGLHYRKDKEELISLLQKSKSDILVMHNSWKNFFKNDHFLSVEEAINLTGCKLLISGDYHQHFAQSFEGESGPCLFLSPGSSCMQSIDEEPDKKCFSFKITNDSIFYSSHPIVSRPKHTIRGHSLEEISALFDRFEESSKDLPEIIRKPIVVAFESSEEDIRVIRELNRERFHLFFQNAQSNHLPSVSLREIAQDNDYIGWIREVVSKYLSEQGIYTDSLRDDLEAQVRELVLSSNPRNHIDRLIQSILGDLN